MKFVNFVTYRSLNINWWRHSKRRYRTQASDISMQCAMQCIFENLTGCIISIVFARKLKKLILSVAISKLLETTTWTIFYACLIRFQKEKALKYMSNANSLIIAQYFWNDWKAYMWIKGRKVLKGKKINRFNFVTSNSNTVLSCHHCQMSNWRRSVFWRGGRLVSKLLFAFLYCICARNKILRFKMDRMFLKIKELGHVNSKRDELAEYCKANIDQVN